MEAAAWDGGWWRLRAAWEVVGASATPLPPLPDLTATGQAAAALGWLSVGGNMGGLGPRLLPLPPPSSMRRRPDLVGVCSGGDNDSGRARWLQQEFGD
jgi:hypothetical protein